MREMMQTCCSYGADDGVQLGLAHYSVDTGKGLALAQGPARQIADNVPLSNYLVIQAISGIQDMSRSEGLFTESLAAAVSQTSDGTGKGMCAFLEKRPPDCGRRSRSDGGAAATAPEAVT